MDFFGVGNILALLGLLGLILIGRIVLAVANWVLRSIWIFVSLAFAVGMSALTIFPK